MQTRSLLRRIVPPLAGVVALLTLLMLGAGVMLMRRAVLENARARALSLAEVEHGYFDRLMKAGSHDDLQELLEQLRSSPDLAVVRILHADRTVHASFVPSEIGQPAGIHGRQQAAGGDLITEAISDPDSASPVAIHTLRPFLNRPQCQKCHDPSQNVIGFLDLDARVNPHMTGITAFTTLMALLGLLYVSAVMGVATPVINVVVRRPVKQLLAAMERVKVGDLDARVEPSGTEEIDALTDGFNAMAQRLLSAHKAEEEARRLHLERVEQLAAVGELAAGLAHEIRNPLSGVKAVLEIVARDTALESRRGVLRDAARELVRIDEVVRDLLQYARPKTPNAQAFDLNALVQDALLLTVPAAAADGGRARCELAADLPPAQGDRAQIRQVLVNLLLNAQQAAGPERGFVVSTGVNDETLWCRVRDFGPGVPKEKSAEIFKPFFTTKARGTGLGLAISHRLIANNGGSLVLDNPGEPGASFTFTLPARSAVA